MKSTTSVLLFFWEKTGVLTVVCLFFLFFLASCSKEDKGPGPLYRGYVVNNWTQATTFRIVNKETDAIWGPHTLQNGYYIEIDLPEGVYEVQNRVNNVFVRNIDKVVCRSNENKFEYDGKLYTWYVRYYTLE